MAAQDQERLHDPARLTAVDRAVRQLPAAPMPATAIARLAARLLDTPMAAITLIGADREHLLAGYGLPHSPSLFTTVGRRVVAGGGPLACPDLLAEPDPGLRRHRLAVADGIRAVLSVPIGDDAGRTIGVLSVFDTVRRDWTGSQAATLTEIAELLRLPAPDDTGTRAITTIDSATLIDRMPQAFFAVDPDAVVVAFNRAAHRLLGHTAQQVCGRHLDESLLPGYGGRPSEEALARLFTVAPRCPVHREMTVRHRDGHRLDVRASVSVLPGAGGALAGVFLTDLSAQTAAEELADRHSSFLNGLLDSLSVGVVACDGTGRVVLLNRAMRGFLHRAPDAPVPDDFPAAVAGLLHHADHTPMAWTDTPLMRAMRGELVDSVDVVLTVPGHRTRVFAATAQPITGADGRHLGAVSAAHEVTAIRRTERFRACHHRVQDILRAAASARDAAPDLLRAVVTALGWPAAELFLIDQADGGLHAVGHYDTTGIDDDGFFNHTPQRGLGITGRVWQTGRPLWVQDIAATLAHPNPHEQARIDACLRRGIRTILAVPVRDGGTLLGVLTCYADAPEYQEDLITVLLDGVAAQIGVYVALQRAEQLARQLARAQNDFLDLVGHELRTPLTSVTTNAGLLADEAGLLDPEQRQMIQAIDRNTRTLQQIIDTLLDLAGLDSGHIVLDHTDLDLAALVADAVADARRRSPQPIDTDVPGRLPIRGDADRLRQVVTDLLSNAATYSPPDGRIQVTLTAEHDGVRLQITDTGHGIADDERHRVFDRFYRGGRVRHHGIPGSGLGLSLARTVVTLHGGTISLHPHHPTGTVVDVRLPATPPCPD